MANSLRAKISKLRHDGHITTIEYQEFLKKMDGHDRELRNNIIDEFVEKLLESAPKNWAGGLELNGMTCYLSANKIKEIAEQLKVK